MGTVTVTALPHRRRLAVLRFQRVWSARIRSNLVPTVGIGMVLTGLVTASALHLNW